MTTKWLLGVLAPGMLSVSMAGAAGAGDARGPNWMEFENLNAAPEYHFYLYPRDMARGTPGNSSIQLRDGRAVSLRTLRADAVQAAGGVFVVAVPTRLVGGAFEPADEAWFTCKVSGVLKARVADANRRVLAFEPSGSDAIRYRVTIGDELELTPVKRFTDKTALAVTGALTHWYCFVIPAAALGLVIWNLMARMRGPRLNAERGVSHPSP